MKTTSWRDFDELSHAEGAIRTYKREVEKLERAYMYVCVRYNRRGEKRYAYPRTREES